MTNQNVKNYPPAGFELQLDVKTSHLEVCVNMSVHSFPGFSSACQIPVRCGRVDCRFYTNNSIRAQFKADIPLIQIRAASFLQYIKHSTHTD